MDYAIYKTNNGKQKRIIHRFTQEEHNHRALVAARRKLLEMWQRVLQQPESMRRNAISEKDGFQYDHMTSAATSECVKFFIDKMP